jgi:aspartate/glutamate/glutamine transport system substrate-binding protein
MMFTKAIALAMLLAPAIAGADGKLDQIRARGKLIVSVKNNKEGPHKDPAHFQKRGFEIELAHLLAQRILGDASRVELRILPRPARLLYLSSGSVDLVISMMPVTDENMAQCDLSHPYFSAGLSLLMPSGTPPPALKDLAGKTIAFREQSFNNYGAELQRIADEAGVKLTVRYYPSFEEAIKAVSSGEAVAMGGNLVDLDAYRKAHAGFSVNAKLLEERRVAVAVKKGDADLLHVVNQTIDDLKKAGELKRMTEKWHLPYLLPAG